MAVEQQQAALADGVLDRRRGLLLRGWGTGGGAHRTPSLHSVGISPKRCDIDPLAGSLIESGV